MHAKIILEIILDSQKRTVKTFTEAYEYYQTDIIKGHLEQAEITLNYLTGMIGLSD